MNQPAHSILLVEDNEDDVFLFQRALKKAGITNPVHVANDGREAVRYLSGTEAYADRSLYPLPALIYLDLKLPYFSGFEVLAWIRERSEFDSTPVVILTSSAEEKDHTRACALGACAYLVKPPSPAALTEILAATITPSVLAR